MSSRTSIRRRLALLVASSAACASPVWADEPDPHALAVQLFDEAGREQDRGAYELACPKFAKVVELEPEKLGAKLALADCYQQAGKLASALDAYRAAAARAAAVHDPRAKLADDEISALEAKVPRLKLVLPEAVQALPGLAVLRDGSALIASQWNLGMPCDAGEHMIQVTALGKKPWAGKVSLTNGMAAEIVIAGLEDVAPPIAAGEPPPVVQPAWRRVPTWAWATGGLGLASGAAALGFAVDQASAQKDFDQTCKNPPRDAQACNARAGRLIRDFGLWIGFGAAGVVALAAATIGAVTTPATGPKRPPTDRLRASMWISPGGAGVTLVGSF